ncbi:MAG: hypothetical protein OXR66_07565 [Candidatus Woesearchaeota archaeon]|nr:hypothetical protein [Candidatus Woesearchaeota archaeon]
MYGIQHHILYKSDTARTFELRTGVVAALPTTPPDTEAFFQLDLPSSGHAPFLNVASGYVDLSQDLSPDSLFYGAIIGRKFKREISARDLMSKTRTSKTSGSLLSASVRREHRRDDLSGTGSDLSMFNGDDLPEQFWYVTLGKLDPKILIRKEEAKATIVNSWA